MGRDLHIVIKTADSESEWHWENHFSRFSRHNDHVNSGDYDVLRIVEKITELADELQREAKFLNDINKYEELVEGYRKDPSTEEEIKKFLQDQDPVKRNLLEEFLWVRAGIYEGTRPTVDLTDLTEALSLYTYLYSELERDSIVVISYY
jgi:hypothetical protein